MTKKKISNLQDHIGYWLRCLSNFVSHHFAARLEQHDVSVAQWVVLRLLYDRPGISQNEAATLVAVDKSSLSRLLERLLTKKLVSRTPSAEDQRVMQLQLTAKGKKLVPLLAAAADENDRRFFNGLSESEQRQFLATIRQLLRMNGWKSAEHGHDGLN
ncbi:MAG TPA: MarR family transcriptional regulator [Alphaproteobacteria bacterium]|jgi:DNA-binding MarR family transcriptional regulator|nr:MarR family transcriptional regulator [Alphaproteobacteria bacterium]